MNRSTLLLERTRYKTVKVDDLLFLRDEMRELKSEYSIAERTRIFVLNVTVDVDHLLPVLISYLPTIIAEQPKIYRIFRHHGSNRSLCHRYPEIHARQYKE
jgi:hypothetical protein